MNENEARVNGSVASEIMSDLAKKMRTTAADLGFILGRVSRIKAICEAVSYCIGKEDDIDEISCLEGICDMLETFYDNVEEAYFRAKSNVKYMED